MVLLLVILQWGSQLSGLVPGAWPKSRMSSRTATAISREAGWTAQAFRMF